MPHSYFPMNNYQSISVSHSLSTSLPSRGGEGGFCIVYCSAITYLSSAVTTPSVPATSFRPSSHSDSRGAACCNWWNSDVVNGCAKGSGEKNRSQDWQEAGSWMIFKKLTTILFITEKNWLQSNRQLFCNVAFPRSKLSPHKKIQLSICIVLLNPQVS